MLNRKLSITIGNFSEPNPNFSEKSIFYKLLKGEQVIYALTELVGEPTINDVYAYIYSTLYNIEIGADDAVGFIDRDDIKLFIYGEQNEFINSVIYNQEIINGEIVLTEVLKFGELKEVSLTLGFETHVKINGFYLGDRVIKTSKPEVRAILDTNEVLVADVINIDCSRTEGLIEFVNGSLQLTKKGMKIPELYPIKLTNDITIPVTLQTQIDTETVFIDENLTITVLNEGQMRQNVEDNLANTECLFEAVAEVDTKALETILDVEILADAIFEIDSRLCEMGVSGFSDTLKTTNVTAIHQLWARWIKTGKRTVDECPEVHRDIVIKMI